jgi:hypothetical protein
MWYEMSRSKSLGVRSGLLISKMTNPSLSWNLQGSQTQSWHGRTRNTKDKMVDDAHIYTYMYICTYYLHVQCFWLKLRLSFVVFIAENSGSGMKNGAYSNPVNLSKVKNFIPIACFNLISRIEQSESLMKSKERWGTEANKLNYFLRVLSHYGL